MLPAVIGLPVVTNPKQKKSNRNEFSLLELATKANIFGWEREFGRAPRHAAPAEPWLAGCTVSCPQLAADPGHLDCDLMAQKLSPISQQLSESAHCGQLTKHHLPMAFFSELEYRQGPGQTHEPIKHSHCPKDLDI